MESEQDPLVYHGSIKLRHTVLILDAMQQVRITLYIIHLSYIYYDVITCYATRDMRSLRNVHIFNYTSLDIYIYIRSQANQSTRL